MFRMYAGTGLGLAYVVLVGLLAVCGVLGWWFVALAKRVAKWCVVLADAAHSSLVSAMMVLMLSWSIWTSVLLASWI